jgi:tetratricopeptide (TPR) repeat protein
MNRRLFNLAALATLAMAAMLQLAGRPALADDAFDAELKAVRDGWAVANYRTPKDQQEAALEKLMVQSAAFAAKYPKRPEALIWDGIVQSTYAGVNGGLGAMAPAKRARAQFEAALALDDKALDGSAYTSLGTLYHKMPGWPVGFGSDKKAREYLEKALQLSPTAIDPNYFYGEFLYDEGEYARALEYLEVAQKAPPRPGREIADAGRQAEIRALIEKTRKKLG